MQDHPMDLGFNKYLRKQADTLASVAKVLAPNDNDKAYTLEILEVFLENAYLHGWTDGVSSVKN